MIVIVLFSGMIMRISKVSHHPVRRFIGQGTRFPCQTLMAEPLRYHRFPTNQATQHRLFGELYWPKLMFQDERPPGCISTAQLQHVLCFYSDAILIVASRYTFFLKTNTFAYRSSAMSLQFLKRAGRFKILDSLLSKPSASSVLWTCRFICCLRPQFWSMKRLPLVYAFCGQFCCGLMRRPALTIGGCPKCDNVDTSVHPKRCVF